MPHASGPRTPQSGELLILLDGRRFVVEAAESSARGWWFSATAQDGDCTVQGNVPLEWDAQVGAWRPRADRIAAPLPATMRQPIQRGQKQYD